jgi:hypothetical protein
VHLLDSSFALVSTMHSWRRTSYTETIFEVEYNTTPCMEDTAVKDRVMPFRFSSSSASACLAQDPLHRDEIEQSSRPTSSSISLGKSISGKTLQDSHIGDMIVDEEGMHWIVRQCFCELAECSSKAFKQLEGKVELDAWDRGRPLP